MPIYLVVQILLQPGPPSVRAQATASVRIVQPVKASPEEWTRPGGAQRRQVVIREKDGQETLVRLIEHQ